MTSKTSQSSSKRESRTVFLWFVFFLMAALFLIRITSSFVSTFQSNIAWINLNTYLRDETAFTTNLRYGSIFFSQALDLDNKNESAVFGLGLTDILQGSGDSAISLWRDSALDPSLLIDYGLSARGKDDFDKALTLFRAADARGEKITKEGLLLAGTICQWTFTEQSLLSDSNSQFCSNYWKENGHNLIINGDLSAGALYGWEGENFFTGKNKARAKVDGDESSTAASLIGQDENNHFGLYQRLSLSAGDTMRFSGRFKMSGKENLAARILYIGWQKEDGTPQGNQGGEQSKQMEWTEFERTFHVPENSKTTFNFYPVTFSGEGIIWFDDIRLELIDD